MSGGESGEDPADGRGCKIRPRLFNDTWRIELAPMVTWGNESWNGDAGFGARAGPDFPFSDPVDAKRLRVRWFIWT